MRKRTNTILFLYVQHIAYIYTFVLHANSIHVTCNMQKKIYATIFIWYRLMPQSGKVAWLYMWKCKNKLNVLLKQIYQFILCFYEQILYCSSHNFIMTGLNNLPRVKSVYLFRKLVLNDVCKRSMWSISVNILENSYITSFHIL